MENNEYLDAWGEDGSELPKETEQRVKHRQKLKADEDEFVRTFGESPQDGQDGE